MSGFGNTLKTGILMGLLMAVCLAVGSYWGRQGMEFAFVFGSIGVGISYFFSDKFALASVGARQLTAEEAPELFEIVTRLATRAGLPMPRIYLAPQAAPNAFATGRNPKHGVVCVTQGLMDMMNSQELEGVLAHEMSHIKHRDILISTIAAVMAGAITELLRWQFWFGGMGGGRNRDGEGNALIAFLVLIFGFFASLLIQMAISRSREFAADHTGAYLAGGPEGLISALKKLEMGNKQIPMDVNPSVGHMFIMQPLLPRAGDFMDLFKTHPNTERRIAKLVEMMGEQNPYAATV